MRVLIRDIRNDVLTRWDIVICMGWTDGGFFLLHVVFAFFLLAFDSSRCFVTSLFCLLLLLRKVLVILYCLSIL